MEKSCSPNAADVESRRSVGIQALRGSHPSLLICSLECLTPVKLCQFHARKYDWLEMRNAVAAGFQTRALSLSSFGIAGMEM
jgi:hypothetical protein